MREPRFESMITLFAWSRLLRFWDSGQGRTLERICGQVFLLWSSVVKVWKMSMMHKRPKHLWNIVRSHSTRIIVHCCFQPEWLKRVKRRFFRLLHVIGALIRKCAVAYVCVCVCVCKLCFSAVISIDLSPLESWDHVEFFNPIKTLGKLN